MGRIIAHINKNSERLGCTISYSTASEYFDHVHRTKVAFPLYDSDFFPYADNGESYWTGYYTTRVRCSGFALSPFCTSQLSCRNSHLFCAVLHSSLPHVITSPVLFP